MSERLQQRRRSDRAKDILAGTVAAALLAMVLSAAVEILLVGIGLLLGEPQWHRKWLEDQLQKSLEWVVRLPLLGSGVAAVIAPQTGWLPAPGAWRDILLLTSLLALPCYVPGRRIGPVLIARFDEEAMRSAPPQHMGLKWAGPLGRVQQAAWEALSSWSQAGTGTGRSPFWRSWVLPDVPEPFSVAVLVGENGTGKSHLAEALSRELDRNDELAALTARSRAAGWALKLKSKWHELWWWRQRHPSQPWDCGYLATDSAALAPLAGFRPRRPTLMIADELGAKSLELAVERLQAARVNFRHPVRLLVIDVALPSVLALRFDSARQRWFTEAFELGVVQVVSMAGSRFGAAQFRPLVGAQPPLPGQERAQLLGTDAEWEPVTAALDEQPVMVAEAVRWVRESGRRYEELQATLELPHLEESLVAHDAKRSTPELPADVLGKRRDLLRERVLRDRAQHRHEGLCQALRSDDGSIAYHVLMLATLAGGGSRSRLLRLLGLPVGVLSLKQLADAFGQPMADDTVPAVKPAVIADELLRLHLGVQRGVSLSAEQRTQLRELMRQAWLLNPGGACRSVARWQALRQPDEMQRALCQLPTLADLQTSAEPGMRIELARAFVELAVFHAGDVSRAQHALALLQPSELAAALDPFRSALLNPEAAGVPALVLWLDLQRLSFPAAGALSPAQAEAFALRLADEALHLLRQCVVVSVPVNTELETALNESAFAALPLVGTLGDAVSNSAAVAKAASDLDRRPIGYGDEGAMGQINLLRERIRVALFAALADTRETDFARRGWASWVLAAVGRLQQEGRATSFDDLQVVSPTNPSAPAGEVDPSVVSHVRAIAFRVSSVDVDGVGLAGAVESLMRFAQAYPEDVSVQEALAAVCSDIVSTTGDPQAVLQRLAAEKLHDIAVSFPLHEGIQVKAAEAWAGLSWALGNIDAQAAAQAARECADLAKRFPEHEGIQFQSAAAWRNLSWAHKDSDAQATAKAAQEVADLAARFPQHEGIQFEAATAWRALSWAHRNTDAQAAAEAAQRLAEVAGRYPWHEGIQREAAEAWRNVCAAHHESDVAAANESVRKVADIAARLFWHKGIQFEAAIAWRYLAAACQHTATAIAEEAAQEVAKIASRFPEHRGIQREAAEAWHHLCVAHSQTSALATRKAAQSAAAIAASYLEDDGIQFEAAKAWRMLSWAHKNTDAIATAEAVKKVTDIADRFGQNRAIQLVAAEAWCSLAWARKDADAQATAEAAYKVAEIASGFRGHEGIQIEAAVAWRYLSSAHADTNAQATAEAAQKVADIAAGFSQNERIQFEAAEAWRNATLAAVKFDDAKLIDRATRALDQLAGMGTTIFMPGVSRPQVSGRVLEQRAQAQVAVQAWRRSRGPIESPPASDRSAP